jgi:hypothetical protein
MRIFADPLQVDKKNRALMRRGFELPVNLVVQLLKLNG